MTQHERHISTRVEPSDYHTIKRLLRASKRLNIPPVYLRIIVESGLRVELERLRGECERRGVDMERLFAEADADIERGEGGTAPKRPPRHPERVPGVFDDPGTSVD